MAKNTVNQIKIYHPKGAKPKVDGGADGQCPIEYVEGAFPGPVLKDLAIESDAVRSGLRQNEANICISVQPGEEKIGQLYICAQHEGKKDDGSKRFTNACMQGQNHLAGEVGQWLSELFADSEEPWQFNIHAEPCPKSDEPFRVQVIADQLEGKQPRQQQRGMNLEDDRNRDRERGA